MEDITTVHGTDSLDALSELIKEHMYTWEWTWVGTKATTTNTTARKLSKRDKPCSPNPKNDNDNNDNKIRYRKGRELPVVLVGFDFGSVCTVS